MLPIGGNQKSYLFWAVFVIRHTKLPLTPMGNLWRNGPKWSDGRGHKYDQRQINDPCHPQDYRLHPDQSRFFLLQVLRQF